MAGKRELDMEKLKEAMERIGRPDKALYCNGDGCIKMVFNCRRENYSSYCEDWYYTVEYYGSPERAIAELDDLIQSLLDAERDLKDRREKFKQGLISTLELEMAWHAYYNAKEKLENRLLRSTQRFIMLMGEDEHDYKWYWRRIDTDP